MAKISERIPFEKAAQIVKEIKEILETNGIVFGVFGSYVRKEETIGDLDLLAFEKDCDRIRALLRYKHYFPRIELYCILEEYEESLETFVLYLTGSGAFNIWLRSIGRNKGYLLNQYWLYERDSGMLVTTKKKKFLEF
jgi:DNA polymerase/3'-5' exonuclease PolX